MIPRFAILIAAAALTGGALPAVDRSAIDASVARIYAPYRSGGSEEAAWERPVFSARTAALIAQWQKVMPADEVDNLNDGDWFCLCQDWDQEKFRHAVIARRALGKGMVEATVRLDIGFGEKRDLRMTFAREKGGWRLDDLFAAQDFPRGLKQALRETIAEDRKLAR